MVQESSSYMDESDEESYIVPIPLQTFLWRNTCPFLKPKLGKLHEALCLFCQTPSTHHEIREACKSLEKVLVQNIQFGLSPSLTEAIKSISRWQMIKNALPHVLYCTAQLLNNRKTSGIQTNLGAAETKLLYTLHWILLDCAEECADADYEKGIYPPSPFHYVFSISSITLFIYLFAPLCHHLRPMDFNNFRLENGVRIWPSLWNYQTPDPVCFSCPVKPKFPLSPFFLRKAKKDLGDVFLGSKIVPDGKGDAEVGKISAIATPPPTPEHGKPDFNSKAFEEELEKLGLPSGSSGGSGNVQTTFTFPETIPEENSSNDEEHVMIFRLGSIPESIREATLFKMSVRQSSVDSSKSSPADKSLKDRKGSIDFRSRTDSSPRASLGGGGGISGKTSKSPKSGSISAYPLPCWKSINLATFLDVAVLRCLFIPDWDEEGVYWGINFLQKRFEEVEKSRETGSSAGDADSKRPRSNSLPNPKIYFDIGGSSKRGRSRSQKEKDTISQGGPSQYISFSACNSPAAERRASGGGPSSRTASMKGSGKRKLTMFDLKAFVETKLLSKSEKMLEKIGVGEKNSPPENVMEDDGMGERAPRSKSALGSSSDTEKVMGSSRNRLNSQIYFNGIGMEESSGSLFKGKSMPSLSMLNVCDELAFQARFQGQGYVGMTTLQVENRPPAMIFANPIITITEHTPAPTPSPDRMARKVSSLENQMNTIIGDLKDPKRKCGTLIRCHSDSEIAYNIMGAHEAHGTSKYIKQNGELNPKICLKALHRVTSAIRSVRVSTSILNLVDFLWDVVEKDEEVWTMIDTVIRIIMAMGCGHGCGNSSGGPAQRCSQSDSVRHHAQNLLLRTFNKFKPQFAKYFQNFVSSKSITKVIDFFHALCSFCVDPSSLLSPMNPKIRDFYASFASGCESNQNRLDSQIFRVTFKRLVTRLAEMTKELRSTENMALYSDVRQFINFVYENDGNTFRKVALSALLDSMEKPMSKTYKKGEPTRDFARRGPGSEAKVFIEDETAGEKFNQNQKKGFFKKKSSSSTCASLGEVDMPPIVGGEEIVRGKGKGSLTPRSSEFDLLTKARVSSKKESRLVSWLTKGGSGEKASLEGLEDSLGFELRGGETNNKRTMRQATIVQKAKKRVEEKLKRIKYKRDSTNDEMFLSTGIGISSRRVSMENIQNDHMNSTETSDPFRERRIVNKKGVRDGLLRFGFLLEMTHPGSLPDPHLMGALLDLPRTCVTARATILMESSFLVHACNRGHWPLWIKLSIFRPSCCTGLNYGKQPYGTKAKSFQMQKAAGKMFYHWGECLNSRLEEFLKTNKSKIEEMDLSDPIKQRELAIRDEEEDFLDEASLSDKLDCPLALQMLTCQLLYEITTFLRETYQTLPKSSGKMAGGEKGDSKSVVSGTGQGKERRWSYASHSLQSIADQHPHQPGNASGERKISFVLNDNESNGSGDKEKGSHHIETPEGKDLKKSNRPLLLRTTPGSSFRRRSIKLQRGKKDDTDSIKRSDSITSARRKVSSISDDTSEQNENSGDESPGVLSNEDNAGGSMEDESFSIPWIGTMIGFINSLNYNCAHQSFCHPLCPRRLTRSVTRLIKAIRRVYGEEFGLPKVGNVRASAAILLHRKDPSGVGKKKEEEPPILKYIKHQVLGGIHAIYSSFVKCASILNEEQFLSIIPSAWELILEPDIQVSTCAATLLILAGTKTPEQIKNLLTADFESPSPVVRMNALLRFQLLWRGRHQVIPRMEENSTFKFPPPGIEFTLPSPRIGVECIPVIDPSWMPASKAKVEEVTLNQDQHVSRRYIYSATKTRKTQQAELVKMALQAEEDKMKLDRQNFLLTSVPITAQASYEPSLHHGEDDGEEDAQGSSVPDKIPGINLTQPGPSSEGLININTGVQMSKSSHLKVLSILPSSICSAAINIIQLLDDPAVTPDGTSVYEMAYQVLWKCLVEDCSLFLRHVFERLTRGRHELMFKILRHLILFVPRLPQQAAFSLYNHIIGFVIFHTRQPQDMSLEMIGSALSILWMVVHSVQGIMFKDLKQILRKEQCDASILLTANVPAAKKIVVHGPLGPDAGGIPTQFPISEDTQFVQILREAYDFFSIDEEQHKEFFLVDYKTHQIHNSSSYVRDFYFFSRAQHPQLSLVHMNSTHAYNALQRQSFILKFLEIGKVTLTWAILKNVDQVMQRVVFLHEELMKLPSFPRKSLESDMDLWKGGTMGKELLGLDVLHKFMWTKLITRMFEAMTGNFAYSGDIHLFINVLSGSLMIHSEDATIIRYIIASFINAAQQFKNIFSTNGYLLVMPPLLLTYCNHQSNALVTGAVEFACKEFYLLHRKPFVLQMFGALAALLDTDESSQYGDPKKVPSKCLFRLLLSLETPTPDPLKITELIHGQQPLKPLDFCYHDDNPEITVLDCISMCVCVVAYSCDSYRGQQMLTILEAVLPPYLIHIQTNKTEGKTEREVINHIAVAMKTLVNNCEPLAKNYTGPQMSSPADLRGSSQKNFTSNKGGILTPDDDSHSKYMSESHSRNKSAFDRDIQDSETIRDEFRRPRDTLLNLVSDFYTKSSTRLSELAKKGGADAKPLELLDSKSHTRLSEVAMALLKVSPYDPSTMACRGLQRYQNEVFPYGEWSHEASRPALLSFLRRLEKTFTKICKKPSIRRHTDWEAAAGLLKGVYQCLWRHSYIVHMQHLKSLIATCQCLLMGDGSASELGLSSAGAALLGKVPPAHFCSTVVRLIALQVRALGESYSLDQACGFSVPPSQEKTDVTLMNVLLPMCLRVGSGRKDVPTMRKGDIVFILNLILNSINSNLPAKIKGLSETNNSAFGTRSGSVQQKKIKASSFQIAFLGLKILCVCFDSELCSEWPRTVRLIQEIVNRGEGGIALWEFLEFVTSIRTSIYPMFHPLINQRLSRPPMNDQERHFQFVLREKIRGICMGKCKGSLLMELAHQMKNLKEELETRKEETILKKKNLNPDLIEGNRRPRPSLSELFPGLAARFGGSPDSEGVKLVRSGLARESSVKIKPSSGQQGRMDRFMRRVSIAGDAPFSGIPENSILKEKQDEEKIGELGIKIQSDSPSDDAPNKHRLQRSKFQSRKTFRFRKSRKGNLEFSSIDVEEERSSSPESPLSPAEDLLLKEAATKTSNSGNKLKIVTSSKARKKSNGDGDSINSFSRTSSSVGYRESFGSVERHSLQMLERMGQGLSNNGDTPEENNDKNNDDSCI